MVDMKRRMRGAWDTVGNPFKHPPAIKWLAQIREIGLTVVEPFVGSGNLVAMLPEVNWLGFYDIEPRFAGGLSVVCQDTIARFPFLNETGEPYGAVITNPPWLAQRAAKDIPVHVCGLYTDLYLAALAACLAHTPWVAALVPASFISSGHFIGNLSAVVTINYDIFGGETESPSCLALFSPFASGNPEVWRGDTYLGNLSQLKQHKVITIKKEDILDIKFCDPDGEMGIYLMDNRHGPSIKFVCGDLIPSEKVKRSSRHVVRAKLPFPLDHDGLSRLIDAANHLLTDFRLKTLDVTLTATRSRRGDGGIRHRLDFETAARILTICLLKI